MQQGFITPFKFQCRAGAAKPSWLVEWEKTVQGAKSEGQIMLYGGEEITHPDILAAFNREFPDITVVTASGHAGIMERIIFCIA